MSLADIDPADKRCTLMGKINFAIIGVGHIARKMALALNGINDRVCTYAVASRSLEKAVSFAQEYHFSKAYGSYIELIEDTEVELIYIATPHAMHFENAMLCLEHGKAVLMEKAFTANAPQCRELIELAKCKGVFLAEAMWTRYMPSVQIVTALLDEGVIGEPLFLDAEYSAPLTHKQRVCDPALAGGALLEVGIYCLNFASMFLGNDIIEVSTHCTKYETGVDATDDIQYTYKNGKHAHLRTSMVNELVNRGIIWGTAGRIEVYDLNNFSRICVYDIEGKMIRTPQIPPQINGLEYEVLACIHALDASQLECAEMPHAEIVCIMEQMDYLRQKWGIVYPFEKKA